MAVLGVVVVWVRLFFGMDLRDESFYVLVPWRWAIGDAPFVNEQNLAGVSGLVMYPFIKVFAIVRGGDPTGLMLYARHLYLVMVLLVAAVVFVLLRRLVRWQWALLVAIVFVTYTFWATPQLSYNTIALAFLTLGASLGAMTVLGDRGRVCALLSGVAYGVAVAAYPPLLFIVPFCAVCLLFAHGDRATAMIAEGRLGPADDPGGLPTGRMAWRALSAWAAGGALVLLPLALTVLSFGWQELVRDWTLTMANARVLQQLGGTAKAVDVVQGLWRFFSWRPLVIVAALAVYVIYRRWPRAGTFLLVLTPVALWLAAQRPLLWGSGFVLLFGAAAPYFFLFTPRRTRSTGAKLLIWVWTPSVIAGVMTAYTSAAGFASTAVGLAPSMMLSGLFVAWAIEGGGSKVPADAREGTVALRRWLAFLCLAGIVAVTASFQLQFQQRDVPLATLTSRVTSGPWRGIHVTEERHELLDSFARDLGAQAQPGDSLLILYEGCGYYLDWTGPIAANTYWSVPGLDGDLPASTVDYYRRHGIVPTLVVRLIRTGGMSESELTAASGGLDYPPALVRPTYVLYRKPAGETVNEVIARLTRE